MKALKDRRSFRFALLATLAFGLVLAACDNRLSIGPTEPMFPPSPSKVGEDRTLSIEGTLDADQGSCLKATILFNGQEIDGARARCRSDNGCDELHLAGVVSAPAGHHTITFRVLSQSAEIDDYRVTGIVEVSGFDIDLPEPISLELRPTRASLRAGQGVDFEIHLFD